MIIVVHHIVADGISIPIVMRDLYELYTARTEKRAPRLPALPLQLGKQVLRLQAAKDKGHNSSPKL